MIDPEFTTALTNAVEHINTELDRFEIESLDDIGIDKQTTRKALSDLMSNSEKLPYNARNPEFAPAIAHQALHESFNAQLAGNTNPDVTANADKIVSNIIKTSYSDPANNRVQYFDINMERGSPSTKLFGPLVDEKQKAYLLDGIQKAPLSAQQHLLNGVSKMGEWVDSEYNHIQDNITIMQSDVTNAFKREGLEYKTVKANLFDKPFDPTVEVKPPSQVPQAMVATLMDRVIESPELDRIGFNYIDMSDRLKEVADKMPQDYSEPMKMALMHQGLYEAAMDQFSDINHTSSIRDTMYKLDDLNAGLNRVARNHYSNSSVGYIPMNKIFSEIDNGPFPHPNTDDKETFLAATHALSKLNNGAQQLALALLNDQKNDPNYTMDQAVDLIKQSADTTDLRAELLGMPRQYNASEFEMGFNVKMSDLRSEKAHQRSPMLRDIILLAADTKMANVTGMETSELNRQMMDFEAKIPKNTDSNMHLGLLHHHLDTISLNAAINQEEKLSGQPPSEATKAQLKSKVNEQSFHIAHKSYLANSTIKIQPYLSKDADGSYLQAPFSEKLPSPNHKAMLTGLSDLSQGHKNFVAQQLNQYKTSANRGDPDSTVNLVFSSIRDLDTAYQSIAENAPDNANAFMQKYDNAMNIHQAQERDKAVVAAAVADMRASADKSLDKGTFPTFALADQNKGIKSDYEELITKIQAHNSASSNIDTTTTQQAMRDFFEKVESFDKQYAHTNNGTDKLDDLKNQEDNLLSVRRMVNEVALEAQDKDLFVDKENASRPNATYSAYRDTRNDINTSISTVKNQVAELGVEYAKQLEKDATVQATNTQHVKP